MFGFSFMFTLVPVIIGIGFVVILGVIIGSAARGAVQWNKNNNSPVLTVEAKVSGKRTDVSTHHHHGDNAAMHHAASSTYYVTFEVESGDRMELCVPDKEFGLIAEGDFGRLTFQGTRYKGFERYK